MTPELPRYLVEKTKTAWAIWDTVEHEWTSFEFDDKRKAADKAKQINEVNDKATK